MNSDNRLKSDTATNRSKRTLFIKPFKKVCIDIGLLYVINTLLIFSLLFIIPDMSVMMLGVPLVGIIAWRGGILAGLLACIAVFQSNGVCLSFSPHSELPTQYFLDGKVSGSVLGLLQMVVCSTVVGYISTLVHRLRNEIALRKAIQKDLEQKNTVLNAFGRTVAHDLKNPLTVINGSIEVLVNDFQKTGSDKTKKMMAFIQNGTTQMVNIIESLLLFAGIRTISEENFTVTPISLCVDDALKRMAYDIEATNATVSKAASWPTVYGYAPWITEVWANYIINAIKYGGNPVENTPPKIELGFDKIESAPGTKRSFVRLWVRDNGEGIPEDKVDTLFKEFSRLDTKRNDGHGLGLSIVKSLTERLGGTVGVERNADKGSCFFFTLPTVSS